MALLQGMGYGQTRLLRKTTIGNQSPERLRLTGEKDSEGTKKEIEPERKRKEPEREVEEEIKKEEGPE